MTPYHEYMERCAKDYLNELMARHNGCVRMAAFEAGVNRTALYQILRKHGLPKERPPEGNAEWRAMAG